MYHGSRTFAVRASTRMFRGRLNPAVRQGRGARLPSRSARARPCSAEGEYRGPRFGPWRRRAIAFVYCLVLLGTPIGHAGLLGLHLITAHGWRPVTARITERIQAELNAALREP